MRIKKRWAALMLAVTLVCTQGNMVMAKVAPDGKTTASGTEFDEWKTTVWDNIKNDWTFVSLTPGADETEMNFAWYSKNGEATTLTY